MSHSKERKCVLTYNEDTGHLSLDIPFYEEDAVINTSTILFLAIHQRLLEDEEWIENLVDNVRLTKPH